MEEMTIQEKAHRYDEALARANEMIKAMTNIGGVAKVDDIQHIFPELKESEDEKIRKDMLEYCHKRMNNEFPSITIHQVKRWLAWLEKQVEKGAKGNEREIPNSEQKPTDDEMKELLRTEYEKGRADALAEVYCQKPERNPNLKEETLTKLIEEIDRLDEERKQNTKYKSAKSGFAHTVRHFFLSNEINTLGELLSLGRKHVARCRNIGKMTMWAIDKALENLYGITEW